MNKGEMAQDNATHLPEPDMSRTNLGVLGIFLALTASLLLCVSCGGGKPSTVSQPVTGTGLTTVSLGNDVTVRVPAGALPDGSSVNVARASGNEAAPGELDGGKSVGSAYKIDVGDQKLLKPVTLEIAFDPKSLPKDTPKEAVFLAYYDEEMQAWVPVGGQVDSARNVISVQTVHLSWWNPFSWDWQAWIAVMKKGLSGKLTDWVQGVQLLTTECRKSGQSVTIDESKANNVLQGCITKDDSSKPELRVVNLKSFYLGISPAPGGPGYPQATLLGPGEAASFTASTSDTPPAIVNADFTDAAMWRFVVGLVARMIPDGDLIPNEGLAFIADGLKRDFAAFDATENLDAGDSHGAAESIYELITGDSFVESFVRLATEYGQRNGVNMMTKWTQAGLSKVFLGVASVDVIVSTTDFLANYVLNNHSAVSFTWKIRSPGQLLPNPSFEEGYSNGSIFPVGWSWADFPPNDTDFQWDSTTAHTGGKSVSLTDRVLASNGCQPSGQGLGLWWTAQPVLIDPSRTYRFSVWAKWTSSEPNVSVNPEVILGSAGAYAQDSSEDTWSEIVLTVGPQGDYPWPDNTTSVQPWLLGLSNWGWGGIGANLPCPEPVITIWYDDASLQQLP